MIDLPQTDRPENDGPRSDSLRAVMQKDFPMENWPKKDWPEDRPQTRLFENLSRELLREGNSIRFQARGSSMSPAIRDGDVVHVDPAVLSDLRQGEIVLVKGETGFRLHRLVVADADRDVFITRGDCGRQNDPAVGAEQIAGIAVAKEVRVGKRMVRAKLKGVSGRILCGAARGQKVAGNLLGRIAAGNPVRTYLIVVGLILFAAALARAQVVVDTTTNANAAMTGAGTHTLTFAHTTIATANRLLLVGVSMNISGVNGATVTGVTYGGVALTSVGAHNDAGVTRRVEMWSLLAPASGANTIAVTVDLPTAGTIGVVAGATTFTGVDQTVPLGSFVSADGAAAAYSQLDVPSVVNGMVLDTLATGGNRTVTIPAWQSSQWNQNTGGGGTDVRGTGSSRAGQPSLPFSETFAGGAGTSNWSLGAVSINPSTADIAVTTSVNAVTFGQNSTYTITVTNNGPSPANSVTLTDTFADANLNLVSYTPSGGTTCTQTSTINCTLPTPFASGATATLTVVVSTAVAGYYPNTATVTDSGTPPDPNTGNNTYVALAPVLSSVCSDTGPPVGGTLTGLLNTYYPGTASVSAGSISIPIGAANGTGTIATGSLLLVIQMQDASINTTNGVAYGNGYTGTGFTTINGAGNYEFVTATGPVSGGSVPIAGAGAGGGLVFAYTAAAASATKGASTYQVVLVPQYSSATLGAATAAAWNGSSGGIFALEISGALNLGGATVSVDGLGFRGGAGMQLTGGVGGANTDFWFTSPATYTGAVGGEAGVDAAKGEGVAGTPMWVESGITFLQTTTTVGYPSGTAGVDGSMARGAPGNAGGGGTDGDPPANDQNSGGGGGGNGGSGGFGGDSWNSTWASGGEGGAPFPATIDRIAMGGGGGAGTRNNSDGNDQASGGAAGGGIIIIRAGNFAGNGTLSANGANAYNVPTNDAGGGGGAGGTIVVLAKSGGEGGLTLRANGGTGGNADTNIAFALGQRHGPGGGGGGGVVFVSAAPASVSETGGANGVTLNNPGVPYGATPGTAGTSSTNATDAQVTGIQAAAVCAGLPDLAITKTHLGTNFTRGGTATYTITVQNVSTTTATSGVVTVNDTLPLGTTPTTASGTLWSCTITGQTVSCSRSDPLGAGASYPSITVTANVLQSAPATLVNTAVVSGGGSFDLLKDTSTDIANVISSADLSMTDAGSPNPVAAGGNITYTQVVTNNGPSAADNATVEAPVPANTTFVSMAAPAGWSCIVPGAGATGNVVCTDVNLGALASGTFTLVVKVNSGTANGTVIADSVTASSSASDPNSANNTATVNTVVGATAGGELTVTNVASPNPVQAGNQITYTQVVTNTGSAAATTATFTENTPGFTTLLSITPPAGWTCTGFPASPCSNPSVGAGASGTFTVIYTVTAGTGSGTTITDTATVNAANQGFGANSATATDVVATAIQADLALTTAATPASVFAGNNITYTQTITNNGPAAATGVSFTEATPTNTTFQSFSAPAGWTCTAPAVGATGNVNCTDPAAMAAGTAADIIVVVNVPATTAAGTITANSSVTATTGDPNAANNSTTVATPLTVACDLSVTNSGTPSPVAAGGNITYTQVVSNLGPSNCSTGTFSEATPLNTTWVSDSVVNTGGVTWTCPDAAPVACTSPTVPPGSTATITATYTVPMGTTAGTIITDTATVATTSRDTNPNNNSATVNIAVAAATQADLSVTNSASPNPVTAGNVITYTQSVINPGPAAAATVSFTDPVPANTTVGTLTGPAGWTCSTGTTPPSCTIASLAANTTANFTYTVKVLTNAAPGTIITETDSVTSTTSDPNSANNSASVNVLVADSADLSVTNTANPIPVLAGGTLTYTQVVNNAGPSTATSVTVTEALPASTAVSSLTGPAGWTCSPVTLTCTNTSLAPSTPATITFVVTVAGAAAPGTAINDTVTVSSAISDPNQANNTATAGDIVATNAQADLITTNSALPTTVASGNNVTYTQSVTNNGPAQATAATFTQSTPPNTTFQSITPPAGWTCGTVPVVGGTGNIICTDGSNLVTATPANFTLVLKVNANTPAGTNITETATATATDGVPNMTTNTASATVVVANANSADMAIVKTGTPNPVTEGSPLTFTLAVTNNGPASATTVTVTDVLPSLLTYLSATTTQGSCSEAGGTVTCLLGTMANAGNATITILTIPGTPGVAVNTATVTADQTDPTPANNSSTWTESITAPTRITLQSFSAHSGTDRNGANRVVLTWKTGGEAHNLGFNVYREQNGNRVRMNPSIIAGSALLMSGALPKHAGRSYAWIDPSAGLTGSSYWLEDIDVNGTRTLHGPVSVEAGVQASSQATAAETHMLRQLNQVQLPSPGSQASHAVETWPAQTTPTAGQIQKQFELAAHPAVKIFVRHEGWYRVGQADLVKAGLDPNLDPALLHLYAEAVEQPIEITGATAGAGGFGPQAAIYFYGTGMDTGYSGTRVYWLVAETGRGARIRQMRAASGSSQPPSNFPATVELRQHTTYFAALLTSDGENFFGALVAPAADQTLSVTHLDTTSSQAAQLEVVLQGIIVGFPHDVKVTVNGTAIGDVVFTGQDKGKLSVSLPPGLLQEGSNTVTLTAQNGDYDSSLVQSIRITYPHQYVADSDELKFTGQAGDEINVSGFTSAPTVLDISDPSRPVQLTPQVNSSNGQYAVALQVPWSRWNGQHTLLAVAADQVAAAAAVWPNHPSSWHRAQPGADIAIITPSEFEWALAPLVRAHRTEGKSSIVVRVGDLYDEYNFGERSPFVIRQFLQTATATWTKAPSYLLLNGRASLDPRNYLGFGHLDLVPTRIVASSSLMTASDDWFSDFTDSGMPTIPTGRLPVSTLDEDTTVVEKIVAYEGKSTNGSWTSQALMVADKDDTESFTQDSQTVEAQLPATMVPTDIFAGTMGTTAAQQDIINGINSGQLLVNYLGHGAEEQWSGSGIFDTNAVSSLTNSSELPVFLIMDCLNGFFQDVYAQPLGVTLLLAPNGGAVAVLASSGLNQPAPQTQLDMLVVEKALRTRRLTMGEAILKAKSEISDPDVRKTYILFGDPAMRIKQPANRWP